MTLKEKNRRKEDFIEWVTFLPDRIIEFKESVPKEISKILDGTPDSLEKIETYIIENYTLEDFQDPSNKNFVDGFVSYIGVLFQQNLPNAKWSINLEDKDNFSFALPVISNEKLVPISLFQRLPSLFYYKSGKELKQDFDAKLNACNS